MSSTLCQITEVVSYDAVPPTVVVGVRIHFLNHKHSQPIQNSRMPAVKTKTEPDPSEEKRKPMQI